MTGPLLATASAALECAEEHRTWRQARAAQQIKAQLRHAGRVAGSTGGQGNRTPWWEADPNASGTITMRSMQLAVRALRQDPSSPLPAAFVGRVLAEAEGVLKATRSAPVTRVAVQRPARLVVVGDTHGQLEDMLWIFAKHGLPSQSVMYLFNGDIVDRGPRALEILTLVLGFLVACPDIMHINRGHHEDEMMNHGPVGGFYDECLHRYGRAVGGLIYDQIRNIYALLPLATVLNSSVFIVHGGLSRCSHFLHVLESVHDRRPSLPTDPRDAREQAVVDALWSDPVEKPGFSPSGRGAAFVCFGPDVTKTFLRETGLSLVVRSHEVPPNLDGIYGMHDGRLLTVFSASNYCGSTGNQGAVLVFYQGHTGLSYDVSRHFAPDFLCGAHSLHADEQADQESPLDAARESALHREEVAAVQRAMQRDPTNARLHQDVLGQVARLVVEHKASLWAYFFRLDAQKSGFVDLAVWHSGCRAVIGDFPWPMLQKLLVVEEQGAGQVDYFAFLQRFRVGLVGDDVADAWADALLTRVYSRILANEWPLRQRLQAVDREGTGVVTIPELRDVLTAVDIGVTRRQAMVLMRTISAHAAAGRVSDAAGGGVDVASFLSRFEMVYRPLAEHRDLPAWVALALKRLGRHLWVGFAEPGEAHLPETLVGVLRDSAARGRDGLLSYAEFAAAVKHLASAAAGSNTQLDFSEQQLFEMAQWVDVDRSGAINYEDFLTGFAPSDLLAGQAFHVDLMEHVCTFVWANKPALMSTWVLFDEQHTGEVTRAQLVEGLHALNLAVDATSKPLTDEQIMLLVDHTRVDAATGKVRYRRFLDSFQVFDTAAPPPG